MFSTDVVDNPELKRILEENEMELDLEVAASIETSPTYDYEPLTEEDLFELQEELGFLDVSTEEFLQEVGHNKSTTLKV